MAASWLQSTAGDTGGSTSSWAFGSGFGSNCTPGSLFVGAVWGDNTAITQVTVSDDMNGTWTRVGSKQNGAGGSGLAAFWLQLFYVTNTSSGLPSATVSVTNGPTTANLALGWSEYTGVVNAPEASAYGNPANSLVGPIISVSQGALVVYACLENTGFTNYVAGSPPSVLFSDRELSTFGNNGWGDVVGAASAGNITGTANAGASGNEIQGIISFPLPGGKFLPDLLGPISVSPQLRV